MIETDEAAFEAVRGPLRLDDVLFQARKANRIAPLQVVRLDRIVGEDHVRSAAWHASRATAEGRNQADRLDVEFVRYLAGQRQIRKALETVGVGDGCPAALVVGFGEKGKDAVLYFVEGLGLAVQEPPKYAGTAALDALGVTDAMRRATPEALWPDLALERVAAVDLMRK